MSGTLAHIPYDVWVAVFRFLARSTPGNPIPSLLAARAACKLFNSAVTDELVAYTAVAATNKHILCTNAGTPLCINDVPFSWWSILMHQRRLYTTWLSGSFHHPDPNTHGFHVFTLNHTSPNSHDRLISYDKACVDSDGRVFGILAHRQIRSILERYLAVHIFSYPDLLPIATHALHHHGFGSRANLGDLPSRSVDGNALDVFSNSWSAMLVKIIHAHQVYFLAYTDAFYMSVLTMRSYAPSSRVYGITLASFPFFGHCSGTFIRVRKDGNYDFCYIERDSNHTILQQLDSSTLHPISAHVIPVSTHYFTPHPKSDPHLLLIAGRQGTVSIWDLHTAQLLDWSQITPDHKIHMMGLRTVVPTPTTAQTRAYRPCTSSPSTPYHRPWTQVVVGWLDTDTELEFVMRDSARCSVRLMSLGDSPNTCVRDLLDLEEQDRSSDHPSFITLTQALGPPLLASEIMDHLLVILQPSGNLEIIDLRDPSSTSHTVWVMKPFAAALVSEIGTPVPVHCTNPTLQTGSTHLSLELFTVNIQRLKRERPMIKADPCMWEDVSDQSVNGSLHDLNSECSASYEPCWYDGESEIDHSWAEDDLDHVPSAPQFACISEELSSSDAEIVPEHEVNPLSTMHLSEINGSCNETYPQSDHHVTEMNSADMAYISEVDDSDPEIYPEDELSGEDAPSMHHPADDWVTYEEYLHAYPHDFDDEFDGDDEEIEPIAGDVLVLDPSGSALLVYYGPFLVILQRTCPPELCIPKSI